MGPCGLVCVRAQAQGALAALAALLPDEADLVEDGGVPRRGASDLRVGDTVWCGPAAESRPMVGSWIARRAGQRRQDDTRRL